MLQRNFDPPAVYPVQEEASPPVAEGWQPTFDLREMARILRRRIRLVALPPVVLVGLALAYVMAVSTLYTATSTVLVDPRRASVVETNQSVLSNFGTDDATIESQTLLIQSVAILDRVVRKLKLTEDEEFTPQPGLLDPIKALFRSSGPSDGANPEDAARSRSVDILQKRMKVTRQGTTFLVDINVSSESPRKAATIANAIADAYFEEQVRSKSEATRIAATWLGGQIDDLKSRVVASEKAVEDFRSANNLTVSQGVTVNDQQITDLNNKLIAARVQTAEARAKYDQAQQIVEIRRRSRRHQRRHLLGDDHQAAHAVCRHRQERGGYVEQIRRAPPAGGQCARAAARHPETDQCRDPAHPRLDQARLRRRAVARGVAAAEPRPAAGRLDLFRPGPGAAARIAARGGGQPHPL